MRHIVLISSSYPYEGSEGVVAGPFAKDFALELSQHAQVTVLAAGPHNHFSDNRNLAVRHFAVPAFPLSKLKLTRPCDWLKIIKSMRIGQQALDAVLKNDRVDLVLALWALPAGFWAMRSNYQYHIPYAVWALGSDILVLGKNPFVRRLLRKILHRANVCFADGYGLSREVEELANIKCHFMPTTRKLPKIHGKEQKNRPPYRFAYLGRWHSIKGIDLLMEALTLLEDKDWNNIETVRICGGGSLEAEVHHGCKALQTANRPVEFTSYLSEEQVSELLHWADYLIIPSRSESIPVVFSEAMSSLCPVICTPVGDMPRLIEQYHVGIQASEVSALAVKKAIEKALLNSPADCVDGMKRACSDFGVKTSVKKFLKYLDCC